MKQNLLKYGLMMVLAMIASTGLLWADKRNDKDASKVDCAKVESMSKDTISPDSIKSNTINNKESLPIQEMNNKKDSISSEGINNSNAQNKTESSMYDLLALLILVLICFGVLYFITKGLAKPAKKNTENSTKEKDKESEFAKWVDDITHNLSSNTSILGYVIVVVIFIMGVSILVFVCIQGVHFFCSDCMSSLSLYNFGLLGDFFGGLIGTFVAVIAAIYAIRTYITQRQLQLESSVENVLKTMLELHKQNVNEIKIVFLNEKGDSYTKNGREAFASMYEELNKIYDVVFEAIESIVNDNPGEYAQWSDDISKKKLAHVISFGYFFYGVETYVLTREAGSALFILSEHVREIAKEKIQEDLRNLQRHNILGHYYRHLYNMVSYIDTNGFSNDYDKKAFYVKLIRSQLSDYEQILLYYNSLSTLGADWNKPKPNADEKIENMSLICKYRLLKNCPSYIDYFGYTPSEMYEKEINTWMTEKGELFFETDSQGQLNVLDEIIARN